MRAREKNVPCDATSSSESCLKVRISRRKTKLNTMTLESLARGGVEPE